jgi:GxxExxY protein
MKFERAELTERIIGSAMKVHRVLGPGFLESVYQNALALELRGCNMDVSCAERIQVVYEGSVVGEFVADMVIDGCVIVENKAVRSLSPVHETQLVHYLTATGLEIGLLLNFGGPSLQVRRKSRLYRRNPVIP